MSNEIDTLQTDEFGLVYGIHNVFAVDGSVLPTLAVQNSTSTIMANGQRIATKFGNKARGKE